MRIYSRRIFVAIVLAIMTGCTGSPKLLIYEIRCNDTIKTEQSLRLTLASNVSAHTKIYPAPDRTEDGKHYFKTSSLIYQGDKRYAITVERKDALAEIFVLPFANRLLIPISDWTEWKKPDYIESSAKSSSAWYTFLKGIDVPRDNPVMDSVFELRYRIEDYHRRK